MKKTKFTIEYQLRTSSINILWNSISTPSGLSKWFADGVTVVGTEFIFTWNQNNQSAFFLESKTNDFIRFQWEEDLGTDSYFEIKIRKLQVTTDLALLITDFAEPNEKDDLILLWDKQIDVLKRKSGI